MNIAYLTNQYPAVSHSFIRREITALESSDVSVARFSIRRSPDPVCDTDDSDELQRTRTVLDIGVPGLVLGLLRAVFTRPIRLVRALWIAIVIGWRSDRGLLRHLAYVAEACVLRKWVVQCRAQHLHAHFATNAATVAMLCHVLGGPPYSFTSHGIEMSDRPGVLGLKDKIQRAAFAVAVCEFGRSQLYRWCAHEDWPKVHVIHCGVDEGFLATASEPVPSDPRLVCVGRLSKEKGHLLLIEVVKRLVEEGMAVEMVLVGDGPLRKQLETSIEERGLRNHFRITGWATGAEVQRHIMDSRAMILPSFAEGLPVVIMEAFALGRPVISTYVAGIPELVEPGISGWLVPAGSVDALTDAAREALAAPVKELDAMGKAGARIVAQRHNTYIETAKLAEHLRAAIALSALRPHQAPSG